MDEKDMKPKGKRGFASMDSEKRREICSKGGKAAHANGTAHKWNAESAREAGKKGGATTSANREHMSRIGRVGGATRAKNDELRKAIHAAEDQIENGEVTAQA
jgi:general stress protein YciG